MSFSTLSSLCLVLWPSFWRKKRVTQFLTSKISWVPYGFDQNADLAWLLASYPLFLLKPRRACKEKLENCPPWAARAIINWWVYGVVQWEPWCAPSSLFRKERLISPSVGCTAGWQTWADNFSGKPPWWRGHFAQGHIHFLGQLEISDRAPCGCKGLAHLLYLKTTWKDHPHFRAPCGIVSPSFLFLLFSAVPPEHFLKSLLFTSLCFGACFPGQPNLSQVASLAWGKREFCRAVGG